MSLPEAMAVPGAAIATGDVHAVDPLPDLAAAIIRHLAEVGQMA